MHARVRKVVLKSGVLICLVVGLAAPSAQRFIPASSRGTTCTTHPIPPGGASRASLCVKGKGAPPLLCAYRRSSAASRARAPPSCRSPSASVPRPLCPVTCQPSAAGRAMDAPSRHQPSRLPSRQQSRQATQVHPHQKEATDQPQAVKQGATWISFCTRSLLSSSSTLAATAASTRFAVSSSTSLFSSCSLPHPRAPNQPMHSTPAPSLPHVLLLLFFGTTTCSFPFICLTAPGRRRTGAKSSPEASDDLGFV